MNFDIDTAPFLSGVRPLALQKSSRSKLDETFNEPNYPKMQIAPHIPFHIQLF